MSIRGYKGTTPRVHPSAFVDEEAAVIGDVVIAADSSVWPMSVVRGDFMPIRIGRRTNVQDGSILHGAPDDRLAPGVLSLDIGDDVTVLHGAILHSCTVESSSLIGMRATVLDGATVPTRTIIGANSLVAAGQHLETGFLWEGSPVKRVRSLKPEEFELIQHLAAHYVKLKNDYT